MAMEKLVTGDFFVFLLPWLLTLAIVYGILEHYTMPKSKSARGIIALVAAFLVLPLAPTLATFLTGIIKALVVVGVGILVMIIFVELLGYKAGGSVKNIFEEHPTTFGIALIIIAFLVFVGAGGMELLGWSFRISENTLALLFFLAVMVLGVWWMTAKKED